MTPAWTDWVGYAAATLTTFSFVPQVRLLIHRRDVSGVSLGMYSAFALGIVLWLAYGLLIGAWPVVVANAITLLLVGTILALKIAWSR